MYNQQQNGSQVGLMVAVKGNNHLVKEITESTITPSTQERGKYLWMHIHVPVDVIIKGQEWCTHIIQSACCV